MAQLDAVARHKKGWKKIELTCAQALRHGLGYAWVDTCCIDKSSSAELSEAINAMFAWYRDPARCYVYLSNVHTDALQHGDLSHLFGVTPAYEDEESHNAGPSILELGPQLAQSRWFTRGWTLQELLAPHVLGFYDRNWSYLGSGRDLVDVISSVTGIKPSVLCKTDGVEDCSVACRMSWAADRETTRIEDEAYSLLGIFGINMPLLYGEGSKAFKRLQEEIIRVSDDQSILAWTAFDQSMAYYYEGRDWDGNVLAEDVRAFTDCGYYHPVRRSIDQSAIAVTAKGIEVVVRIVEMRKDTGKRDYALLNCIDERNPRGLLALKLGRLDHGSYFIVGGPETPFTWSDLRKKSKLKRVLLRKGPLGSGAYSRQLYSAPYRLRCIVIDAELYKIQVLETFPGYLWEPGHLYRAGDSICAFKIHIEEQRHGAKPTSTTMAVCFKHSYSNCCIMLQEENPGISVPLGVTCELVANKRTEGMKPFGYLDWSNRSAYDISDFSKYPSFAVGPYNVRVGCTLFPSDDSCENLSLLIYRRIDFLHAFADIFEMLLAWIALLHTWTRRISTTRSPDATARSQKRGLKGIIDGENSTVNNLVSDDLNRYGTKWQRLRMRLAKFQTQEELDELKIKKLKARSSAFTS